MKKIHVPFLDHDGTLSPLVNEALAKGGVTVDNNFDNLDEIILTFDKATDANAFLKAMGAAEPEAPVEDPAAD